MYFWPNANLYDSRGFCLFDCLKKNHIKNKQTFAGFSWYNTYVIHRHEGSCKSFNVKKY